MHWLCQRIIKNVLEIIANLRDFCFVLVKSELNLNASPCLMHLTGWVLKCWKCIAITDPVRFRKYISHIVGRKCKTKRVNSHHTLQVLSHTSIFRRR